MLDNLKINKKTDVKSINPISSLTILSTGIFLKDNEFESQENVNK